MPLCEVMYPITNVILTIYCHIFQLSQYINVVPGTPKHEPGLVFDGLAHHRGPKVMFMK